MGKQLVVGAAILVGTFLAVGPAWSQGDSRLRQGAPIGSPLNPGTANPEFVKKVVPPGPVTEVTLGGVPGLPGVAPWGGVK